MPITAVGQANAGQSLKVIVTRVYAGNGVQEAVDGALSTPLGGPLDEVIRYTGGLLRGGFGGGGGAALFGAAACPPLPEAADGDGIGAVAFFEPAFLATIWSPPNGRRVIR